MRNWTEKHIRELVRRSGVGGGYDNLLMYITQLPYHQMTVPCYTVSGETTVTFNTVQLETDYDIRPGQIAPITRTVGELQFPILAEYYYIPNIMPYTFSVSLTPERNPSVDTSGLDLDMIRRRTVRQLYTSWWNNWDDVDDYHTQVFIDDAPSDTVTVRSILPLNDSSSAFGGYRGTAIRLRNIPDGNHTVKIRGFGVTGFAL